MPLFLSLSRTHIRDYTDYICVGVIFFLNILCFSMDKHPWAGHAHVKKKKNEFDPCILIFHWSNLAIFDHNLCFKMKTEEPNSGKDQFGTGIKSQSM